MEDFQRDRRARTACRSLEVQPIGNAIVYRDAYPGCSIGDSLKSTNAVNIVFQSQILPALQSERHIAVLPQKIMKGLQIE